MEILNFNIEREFLGDTIIDLSDEMRLKLHQTDETLFNSLDYNDDTVFMSPILFYYLYAKENKETSQLSEVIYNYVETKPKSKTTGIINNNPQPDSILLPDSHLKIYKSTNPFLTSYLNLELEETVQETIEINKAALFNAWEFLKLNMPEFCEIIEMTTKEISVFNAKNQNSFAALQYLGTAFINVNGQHANEIFFIDDLSHQCGHVIFYFLTLKAQEFFIPSPQAKLSDYSKFQDNRSLYDAFHGLFTYITTLNALSGAYKNKAFDKEQKEEIIGRIGFYMQKFGIDIQLTDHPEIFSSKGQQYYTMFKKSWDTLYSQYYTDVKDLDYSNQDYFYNHNLFLSLNKKEK